MLTQLEISEYSLLAGSGDNKSKCILSLYKLLQNPSDSSALETLNAIGKHLPEAHLYIGLIHKKNKNHTQALLSFATAIDMGDSFAPYFLWQLSSKDPRYLQLASKRTLALAVGRGAMALCTSDALPTELLDSPDIDLSGRIIEKNDAIVTLDLTTDPGAIGGGALSAKTA